MRALRARKGAPADWPRRLRAPACAIDLSGALHEHPAGWLGLRLRVAAAVRSTAASGRNHQEVDEEHDDEDRDDDPDDHPRSGCAGRLADRDRLAAGRGIDIDLAHELRGPSCGWIPGNPVEQPTCQPSRTWPDQGAISSSYAARAPAATSSDVSSR